MISTFDEWVKQNCSPPENYSFGQYANYIQGWRNSMPWSWNGMSIAYDNWAENKWAEIKDKERLRLAWKEGLAIKAKAYSGGPDKAWRGQKIEDAADFMLTFKETIAGLIAMSAGVLSEQMPHLANQPRDGK